MTTEELVTRSIYHSIRERLVVDGWLPDIMNYDLENPNDTPSQRASKFKQFQDDIKNIQNTKGFSIELFSYMNNQDRGVKKVPRIVINISSFLPSTELGNETAERYVKKDNYFTKVIDETMPSDLLVTVYAVGGDSNQMYTMNNLIMTSLPKRGYIKSYLNILPLEFGNFFMRLTDKGETEALSEGTLERYYIFEVKDLKELPEKDLDVQISPINEIGLDIKTE